MAARFEWRRISHRQREKFDELRRQGRKRGRPATPTDVADRIVAMRDDGATYQKIAEPSERHKDADRQRRSR
jgi:DNA invertase Pin-like site-specific DNA recombinase